MDEVLFCPFCGEAFEGETRCPEHELLLVPWGALPTVRPPVSPHAALPWYAPGSGRALVAGGALLTLLAFVALPLARVDGALQVDGSMLRLALQGTPRLWLVPAAAWVELAILYRRRSPISMRGARIAVLVAGCGPLLTVLSTWLAAKRAVALLAERTHSELHPHFGAGAYAVGVATLLLFAGGLRLGAVAGPHGRSDSGR
jgi:hypothetical protein